MHKKIVVESRPQTALVLSEQKWGCMTDLVNEGRKQQELLNEEADRKAYKRQLGKKITDAWPNTLKSIQRDRDTKFREMSQKAKEQRMEEYKEIMADRARRRQEIIDNAKRILFEKTESNRIISSGLVLSTILEERQKQMDLAEEKRREMYEKKLAEGVRCRELAEQYRREDEQKKIDQHQQKENTRNDIDQQMREVMKRRQMAEKEKAKERQDLIDLQNEMTKLKKDEDQEKADRKNKLKQDQEEWAKITEQQREKSRRMEQERDQLNAIFQAVREKLDKHRDEKEIKLRSEIVNRRAQIPPEMLPQKQDYSNEEALIEKAWKENSEKLEKEHQDRIEKKKKLKYELIKMEKETAKKAEKERREVLELRRIELLQRLALEETDQKWRKKQQEEKKRIQKQIRDGLLEQWAEREKLERESRWDDMTEFERAWREEKDTLLAFSEDIVKEAEQAGKPMYPIIQAIDKMKKSAGIQNIEKKVPFLQSRVPIKSVAIYYK